MTSPRLRGRLTQAVILPIAAFLLVACTTPRRPATPAVSPPAQWQATLPHGGEGRQLTDWWSRFDDPLLPALMAQAQSSSPTLAQALARVAQARAAQRGAQSQRWPALNLTAQAQRASTAPTFVPGTQASAGVDASWEVDLFGGTRAQLAAAEARSERAGLDWHAARITLAADVAATYVSLRSCEALRAVFDADAASQLQSAALTRDKVRVGFEAPANGALADGAAADAGNRAIAQRADCDALLQSLAVLSGQSVVDLRPRLAARTAQLPQPVAFTVATLPTQLLAQRPDIAAAERDLVAAAADVGVAEAARYPRLSFSGSLGVAGLRVGGQSSDGNTWGFGPALTLPLFDAGQRAANQAAAVARYDEARAALDGRLRTAVGEVEEALLRLDAATRREAEAQRAAQGFRDYFAAAEARWRIGAGSLIDREDARRVALTAQTALLTVQRERVAAWVTLYRVLGGGWSAADAEPLTPLQTN